METAPVICIVDDEPEFVAVLKDFLTERSFEVTSADERHQAEDRVREQPPNLVILGTLTPRGAAYQFH